MTVVEYKGLYYDKSEEIVYPEKLNATFALDKYEKLVMNGKVTFNFHHNSYAFGPEVVLAVYTPVAPEKKRRADNNNWYRNEIPFPICSETRDFFLKCAMAVDAKLKGL